MKNRLLTLTILLFFVFGLSAQEQLHLTIDRTIYIGGEDVWFSLTNINNETHNNSTLSKVAYVELLNQSNVPVVKEKIRLSGGVATSKIAIPDTASTGNYLLRTYTRWMTNDSPENYESVVLSVINPFAANALPDVKVDRIDNENKLENRLQRENVILGLNTAYSTRQKVTVNIETKDWKHLTASVVKSCLYDPINYLSASAFEDVNLKLKEPEHNGEIIGGTITNTQTGEPIVDEKIMLSFVGQNPVLKFSVTDSIGAFIFEVNRFGEQEMVIQPYSTDTTKLNYKVTLKENYSSLYADHKVPDLQMDSITIKEINEAIINMQVNTIYSSYLPDVAKADSIEKAEAFYGQPENSILIDKYIELPTTEEVIREIVPMAFLRKSEGEYYVKVFEDKSLYPKEGKTMTFVDGVPINQFSRVLDISPSYLEKIDVLNLNYYYEDENLGRLLMFYTRNGDMGNMEFDHRIFRQVHQGYLDTYKYISPDHGITDNHNTRLADYRNVLVFSTFNDLKRDDQVELNFTTSDDVSDYTIVLTGINEKGEKETVLKSFKVE